MSTPCDAIQGNASPEHSVTGESTQIKHKYEGGTPQRGLQEFAHSRLPSKTLILAIVTSKLHVRDDTGESTIGSTHVSENAIWHHICEHRKLVRKTTLVKSHSLLKASSPHFKATSVQRRIPVSSNWVAEDQNQMQRSRENHGWLIHIAQDPRKEDTGDRPFLVHKTFLGAKHMQNRGRWVGVDNAPHQTCSSCHQNRMRSLIP